MKDEILIRYIKRECSEEEAREVLSWIELNKENRKYYNELLMTWTLVDLYLPEFHAKSKTKSVFTNWLWTGVAVAACGLGLLWGLSLFRSEEAPEQDYQSLLSDITNQKEIVLKINKENTIALKDTSALITYANKEKCITINDTTKIEQDDSEELNVLSVPYGKRSKLILPDSSTVYLNSGSSLIYPTQFVEEKREVYLDGEAYFDVVKDGKKHFVVKTKYKDVEVLGTQFNVCADEENESFETVLVKGCIALDGTEGKITLQPNQYYGYSEKSSEEEIKTVDVSNYVSWIKERLKFQDEPMGRIIHKLEKIYNVRIILKDNQLDSLSVSGSLDLRNPLKSIMNSLMMTVRTNEEINKPLYEIKTN